MSPRTMQCVRVHYFLPDEMEPGVQAVVEANVDLLPNWIASLEVHFDDEAGMMIMRPIPEYRRAKLKVGPAWLDSSPSYRETCVIHEFMHVQLGPLHLFAARLIEIAGKDNDALDTELREQLRIALESTTSDLEQLTVGLVRKIAELEHTSDETAPGPRIRREHASAP